jgi:hypothetical protein
MPAEEARGPSSPRPPKTYPYPDRFVDPDSGAQFDFPLESAFTAVPTVVQFQLVQRAAADIETGGAVVAAVVGDADETVVLRIEHHAVIRVRAVQIGARCRICRTESVQNLERTIRPALAVMKPASAGRLPSAV